MISKEIVKMQFDNAIKEAGYTDVDSFTNTQLLDLIAEAIAKSVPSQKEIEQDLGCDCL